MISIITDDTTEAKVSELPAIEQLVSLGYDYIHGNAVGEDSLERSSFKDVVFKNTLLSSLKKLNPKASEENLSKVIRELTLVTKNSLIDANRYIYEYLLKGTSKQEAGKNGNKHETIKVIDFDNPENNIFQVVNQIKYLGPKEPHIKPDIVIYVNGLPLAVIECKQPYISNPLEDAIDQLRRYANTRKPDQLEGCEKLFYYNQIMVATCRDQAVAGTISSSPSHFLSWHNIDEDLKGTPQDILIETLFKKENFLDIIKNFIVFDVEDDKRVIKKMPRYQQFRAVQKAVDRLQTKGDRLARGGTIWHTQGSGKTLTMAFLASKIRSHKELKDSKLVFILDRTELLQQLSEKFKTVLGETIFIAESVKDFKELIKNPTNDIVIGMLQKFQENELNSFPELNPSSKVIVLVDEAHRGHYSTFATNLNIALPNAPKIAFTGTPLLIDDKTYNEFGKPIDEYNIEDAVRDGATLQIIYEGREVDTKLTGAPIDEIVKKHFKGKPEDILKLVEKYGKESVILNAPNRIAVIAKDILDHYKTKIQKDKFKAQIVCSSRRAAVLYKNALDELGAPESTVIISGNHNDDATLTPYTDPEKHKTLIERFKKPMDEDALSFIIVSDKLLTGFDAPIEQVMYLDKKLIEHNLLQAIARVNRTAKGKDYGYIVDYYGLTDYLEEALKRYKAKDVKGALQSIKDEIPKLEARHRKVKSYFEGIELSNTDECVFVLKNEKVREEFRVDFNKFLRSLNAILPNKEGAPFISDMRLLGKISFGAQTRYRDPGLGLLEAGAKVRDEIYNCLIAEGVDPKVPPFKLFDHGFAEGAAKNKNKRAQAHEYEGGIRTYINDHFDENEEYYKLLTAKLNKILKDNHDNWEELLKLLMALRNEMKDDLKNKAKNLNLNETQLAFHMALKAKVIEKDPKKENDKNLDNDLVTITTSLANLLEEASKIVDFFGRESEVKEVTKQIRRTLDETPYFDASTDRGLLNELCDNFLQIAKVRFK